MQWVDSAYICSANDYETLALMRDIGFARTRVQRVDKFQLIESQNELLFAVTVPENSVGSLLITGSDKQLDLAKPEVILCFIEQSE